MNISTESQRFTNLLTVGIALGLLFISTPHAVASVEPSEVANFAPPYSAGGFPRTAAWPWELFKPRSRAIYDSAPGDVTPHPSVARIIVPERGATAFGSGTLIDVRDQRGLVITNWHVVKDNCGTVEVVFPGGFRSQARPLKLDEDWDLAALVIWRPPVEPVKVTAQPPRQGDILTIHGYGRGQYRIATGRCTDYYAPHPNYPHEILELDVEARQGDSGGPIFNQSGELAGVLFGAGEGTTLGSFAPRVRNFLATIAPDIGRDENPTLVAAADRPAPSVASNALVEWTNSANYPSSPWKPAQTSPMREDATSRAQTEMQMASNSEAATAIADDNVSWADFSHSGWYESLKSALAVIGLAAVSLRLIKSVR